MRRTRILAGLGIAAVAALALTACNSGSPSSPGGSTDGDTGEDSTWFEVASDASLDGSPTYDRMVERDGVNLATISTPGALIGEMSVVLGTPNSANVRAGAPTTVRVIADARTYLEQDQALTFRIAWLMASRLDATSAYLVELSKQHGGKAEQNLLGKILSALHLQGDDGGVPVNRSDMFGDPGGAFRY